MKTENAQQPGSSAAPASSAEPIHGFFGLSYANYLVLPRVLLQSCSPETQQALCGALERVYQEEKANMPHHWPHQAEIVVKLKDVATGQYKEDDLADYQRGRRRLWQNVQALRAPKGDDDAE